MRRILTAREQVAMLAPWRVAEQLRLPFTTKLYRGLNLDTTTPGLEKVHAILHPPGDPPDHHPGWDHPAVGGHLLDWIDKAKGGLGGHWTADPTQAEQFARWPNEDTGRGGNLQAVIEADWDGEGEDPHRTDTHEFSPSGERIRSFPQERETTLSPDAQLGVSGVKIRPYDDDYWNNPATGDEAPDENHDGPWHHVLSEPSMRHAHHRTAQDWMSGVPVDPLDPKTTMHSFLLTPWDAYDPYEWSRRHEEHPPIPTPNGVRWIHVTPADLPVGTVLAPRKGRPPWLDNPYNGGLGNRANFIWIEYVVDNSEDWCKYMLRDHGVCHIYEVKPRIGPLPWNGSAEEGWVSDAAVILRKLK